MNLIKNEEDGCPMPPYKFRWRDMRFKKVAWSWTAINLLFTYHYGKNPVSGHRFLYIGVGPFLGFDFYWPAELTSRSMPIWNDIG